MTTTAGPISRRRLLAGAGALSAAAIGGAALSSCSGGGSDSGGSGGGSGERVALPTYIPYESGTADLPGDPERGINAGYFAYPLPQEQTTTVEGEVGTGGPMQSFVVSYSPPPASKGSNAYWQAIDQALNVDWQSTLVPAEFQTKLAAMLTSDQIPDIVTMYPSEAWTLRRWESLAQAKFADLSDELSGDAIQQYPNLARLGDEAWRPTYVNGRIYATPTLRISTGSAVFSRSDVITELGADPQPGSAAEFEAMCEAITDRDAKRYALVNEGSWMSQLIYPMFGVPNGWRADDAGGLVNTYETEEWREAIRYTAQTWSKGYWHPDSPSGDVEGDPLFAAGTVLLRADNIIRYTVRGSVNFAVDLMPLFLHDGGPASPSVGASFDFVTFVKKGSPERVQETLRVLNYLSAPFGSTENFLRTFGPSPEDHTIVDGVPQLTDRGQSEVSALSLRFIAGGPDVLFASNGNTDIVRKVHAYQTDIADRRVQDPVAGLYAESASQMGNVNQQVTDAINDVILARRPESALDEAVTAWRNGGGDKVREEYQEALAEQAGR